MKRCNLFYLSAALFYLAAVLNFFSEEKPSMAVVWLCLGTTFLSLGFSGRKK